MLSKPRVTPLIATAHVIIYLPIAILAYTSLAQLLQSSLLLIIYCIILYPDVKKTIYLIPSV
ncbi:MAG: hypothetical protein M3299_13830, partial [Thermoproteota archaeon]|nr:hypothetical protein [Thermoproteota archaeon]